MPEGWEESMGENSADREGLLGRLRESFLQYMWPGVSRDSNISPTFSVCVCGFLSQWPLFSQLESVDFLPSKSSN